MKKRLNTFIILVAIVLPVNILASANGIHLDQANTDISDEKSLQHGAKLFMNHCSGCHSIYFMRYNRISKDLNIPEQQVKQELIFDDSKIGDVIASSMPKEEAKKWFGGTPPDLSLVARSKGVDWIYTYLRGFYKDEKRIFGVNNKLLKNVSMPDVLWSLKASQSEQKFNQDVRDIVNFLDYVGEPAKLIRVNLGIKVMLFLSVLLLLSYLLKKEYWKDVKYGKWRLKD